jgi:FAD/FMN-containing dehydrogenase
MQTEASLTSKAIDEQIIAEFQAGFRGELLRSGDAGYEDARKVFNAMIDKHPAIIVRCAGAVDVIRAVNFARAHNLLIAVRGVGHNVAGTSICEGGILIDLSRMKGMRIDPVKRTVRVEPGLTWGEVNDDLQEFGLAATGGFVSTTGVSGLTVGGGLGWLVRKYGLALDNLLSVDVVTADGSFLTASSTQNEDLFWGIRGGGGNFGIVTSFEFEVHPAGVVLAGLVLHPVGNGREALRLWRTFEATAPEEFTAGVVIFNAPPDLPLPEGLRNGAIVGMGGVYAGPLETGEQALRPLRQFGPPLADTFQNMPYSAAQKMADFLWPRGLYNYWKSSYLKELSDDAIDTILEFVMKVPSLRTVVVLEHNGNGAMSRIPEESTAFGGRQWPFNFLVTSAWTDAAAAEANIRWTRAFWDAMQPFLANAAYVNYLGEEGEDRVRAAYGAIQYERLAALKKKYDPTNLFRLNQNIKPAA